MKFTIRNSQFKNKIQTKTHAKKAGQAKIKIQKNLSNSFYRAVCILALFLMALILIPSGNQYVHAETQADVDNLNAQISTLTVQLNEKKAVAKTFADEVAIYDGKIQQIQLQIQATQMQIDVQNAQITDINGQIATKEADLKIQKESLREQLKVIYENSNTSTLELIASSDSFSDFVDQTEYLQTMQIKTKETIGQIKSLKQQLEDNKNNVEKKKQEISMLQKTQLNQKAGLDNERYGKQMLLNQANSQGKQYQNSIAAKEAQKAELEELLRNPPPPPSPAPPVVITPPPAGDPTPPSPQRNVPQLYQYDSRWANTPINGTGDTIKWFGCKLTSLVMIFQSYGYNIYPNQLATDSRYFSGSLLISHGTFYNMFQLSTNYGSPTSAERQKADQWASQGKPFIASGRIIPGYSFDHSVVIIGKSADGRWVMNDPWQGPNLAFPNVYISNLVFVN